MRSVLSAGLTVLLALGIAAAQSGVTIRVAMPGGADQSAVWEELNQQFTDETGVAVEFQIFPTDQYYPIINARIVGNDAPDVIGSAGIDNAKLWLRSGVVADLSDQPWARDIVQANQVDATLGLGSNVYQFTLENVGVGLFYNKTMLDAAGVALPQSYPEFVDAMTTLMSAGHTPLIVGAQEGWGPQMAVFLNAVNTIYRDNPDFDEEMVSGVAKFDSPAWIEAHQRVADWAEAGFFDPRVSLGLGDFDAAVDEFKAGRAAFLIHGSWNLGGFEDVTFEYGFAAYPGGPAGSEPIGIILSGTNFIVNAKSRNVAAAKEYVAFLARNADAYLEAAGGGGFGSLTTSAFRGAALAEFAQAIADNRANDYFPSNWGEARMVQDPWKKVMQNILLGQDVRAQMRTLDAEFDKYRQ